jgi:hypothetical protein
MKINAELELIAKEEGAKGIWNKLLKLITKREPFEAYGFRIVREDGVEIMVQEITPHLPGADLMSKKEAGVIAEELRAYYQAMEEES